MSVGSDWVLCTVTSIQSGVESVKSRLMIGPVKSSTGGQSMSDVVPAEKVIEITETAAVLVRACHHYQVRRVIGPRFTGIERGANIHRWAKSDGREKRKSDMHWISPNGFSHAEAQTKYPKREYIKLFHTETPLASHSRLATTSVQNSLPPVQRMTCSVSGSKRATLSRLSWMVICSFNWKRCSPWIRAIM